MATGSFAGVSLTDDAARKVIMAFDDLAKALAADGDMSPAAAGKRASEVQALRLDVIKRLESIVGRATKDILPTAKTTVEGVLGDVHAREHRRFLANLTESKRR